MLDSLITSDKTLTLFLNGSNSLFWDGVMHTATATQTWIPCALVLFYVLVKNNYFKNILVIFTILLSLGVCILLADQLASGLCKPLVQRFRPTNDPELMYAIDIVNGYRGGRYGFFSSHAANTFSTVLFLSLRIKYRPLSLALISWALLNCYSRIYLGVHYAGDVLTGILCGCLVGVFIYYLCNRILRRIANTGHNAYISSQYTPSGYLVEDVRLITLSLVATYFYITVQALFFL